MIAAGARPRSGAYYSLARQAQTGAIAEAGTPQGTDYDSPARVRVSSAHSHGISNTLLAMWQSQYGSAMYCVLLCFTDMLLIVRPS